MKQKLSAFDTVEGKDGKMVQVPKTAIEKQLQVRYKMQMLANEKKAMRKK